MHLNNRRSLWQYKGISIAFGNVIETAECSNICWGLSASCKVFGLSFHLVMFHGKLRVSSDSRGETGLKTGCWGWGGDLVSEMFIIQAGHLCLTPRAHVKKSRHEWWTFVNPSTGRQRRVDPWRLLVSQPSLLGKFWVEERPCLKGDWLCSWGWPQV